MRIRELALARPRFGYVRIWVLLRRKAGRWIGSGYGGCNPCRMPTSSSFNGGLRDKCLNVHQFVSLEDEREKIEAWRLDYGSSGLTARSGT